MMCVEQPRLHQYVVFVHWLLSWPVPSEVQWVTRKRGALAAMQGIRDKIKFCFNSFHWSRPFCMGFLWSVYGNLSDSVSWLSSSNVEKGYPSVTWIIHMTLFKTVELGQETIKKYIYIYWRYAFKLWAITVATIATNKHIIVIHWVVDAVTKAKTSHPFITGCGVGWMLTSSYSKCFKKRGGREGEGDYLLVYQPDLLFFQDGLPKSSWLPFMNYSQPMKWIILHQSINAHPVRSLYIFPVAAADCQNSLTTKW